MNQAAQQLRLKFLIIRRDNIGDLVCTTPLFSALRQHYPNAYLAALVNSYNAEVLEGNPDLDEVFVYTKFKHRDPSVSALAVLWQRFAMIRKLRSRQFDIAILAKSGFDQHGLKFARLAGARRIIGFPPVDRPAPATLTDPIQYPEHAQHEVETVMRLAQPLGITTPPGPLRVFPNQSLVTKLRSRLLHQDSYSASCYFIALHISARETARCWPADKFIALIKALSAAPTPTKIVLLWSPGTANNPRHPGDDEKAAEILGKAPENTVFPMPTHHVSELVAVLAQCNAFIGADGGALHLAAACGLPIVALFENDPYKVKHWYPWRTPHEMVISHLPEVGSITLDQVVAAWKRLETRLLLARHSAHLDNHPHQNSTPPALAETYII